MMNNHEVNYNNARFDMLVNLIKDNKVWEARVQFLKLIETNWRYAVRKSEYEEDFDVIEYAHDDWYWED